MTKIAYSINGLRRNLAAQLKELKKELDYEFAEGNIEDKQSISDIFNELACLSNSFNHVHIEGVKEFDDLSSDPEVKLFD